MLYQASGGGGDNNNVHVNIYIKRFLYHPSAILYFVFFFSNYKIKRHFFNNGNFPSHVFTFINILYNSYSKSKESIGFLSK